MISKLKAFSQAPRRGEFITRRLNGGINYSFRYGLTSSELVDGGDIDLLESGAIASRRALLPLTTTELETPVIDSWAWQDIGGTDYLFIVLTDGAIYVRTGTDDHFELSVFGAMVDGDSRCNPHAWSAGGWLYVSDGFKVWRWGGSAFGTYQDVTSVLVHPESPTPEVTNLGVPPNCAATTYRDTVFIGNTLVYMTDPDAIWWSAPVAEQPDGSPLEGNLTGQEDFYENQRITFISGNQADRINKLVAAGPSLYAFKRHSVHILSTTGATVLTNDLSTNLGLAGWHAVAVRNNDVWFFDEHQGLHVISGNGLPERVFDPIFPLLDCGRISHPDRVAVGFDGSKVFVSVCLDGAEQNNVTFVLNLNLSSTSRGGAWSRWDIGFSNFVRWEPQDGDSSLVGFTSGGLGDPVPYAAVRVNECSDSIIDDFGFSTRRVRPWFESAFFDDGLPTLRKRWDRLAMTISGTDRVRFNVEASTAPKTRPSSGCEMPEIERPTYVHDGSGSVDVDLTDLLCEIPPSTTLCDTDSRGEVYQNGLVFCDPGTVGPGPTSVRQVRIASPGTGVSFKVRVSDDGSDAAWQIQELDVKYVALIDYI